MEKDMQILDSTHEDKVIIWYVTQQGDAKVYYVTRDTYDKIKHLIRHTVKRD